MARGRILSIILGSDEEPGRTSLFGSSKANGPKRDGGLGLTTPTTIQGNTVIGPAGGRATKFATERNGVLTNVRNIPSSSWKAQSGRTSKGGSLFGGRKDGSSSAGAGSSSKSGSASRGGFRSDTKASRDSVGPTRKKEGGMVSGKKWIQSAVKKPGALRSALNVKAGAKIPAKKLAAAAKKPGKMGQRARLAITLKSFKKGK
jgi:hypothetical protein